MRNFRVTTARKSYLLVDFFFIHMKADLSVYSSSVGLNSGSSLIDRVICNLTHSLSLTTYLPTFLATLISTHIHGYMSPSIHPFSNPSIHLSSTIHPRTQGHTHTGRVAHTHAQIKSTHLSILCPSDHPSPAYTRACSGPGGYLGHELGTGVQLDLLIPTL